MRQLSIAKNMTNRNSIAVDKYINDVARIPLITAEEEVQLAQRIKQGDPIALDKLIKSNLRFVISVAKQYQNLGLPLMDVINEGNIGLIKAAQRFDETKGFKFISYAVWWIRQTILQAIAEHGRLVRLPQNKINTLNKVNKILNKVEQENQIDLINDDILDILSDELNMSPEKLMEFVNIQVKASSMDKKLADDSENDMYSVMIDEDSLSPDDEMDKDSLRKDIEDTIAFLPDRDKLILKLTYGIGHSKEHSISEIGEMIGLSPERVRQIRDRSLRRLKHKDNNLKLKKHL